MDIDASIGTGKCSVGQIVQSATKFCTCSNALAVWCGRALAKQRRVHAVVEALQDEARRRGETGILQQQRTVELVNVLDILYLRRQAEFLAWLAEQDLRESPPPVSRPGSVALTRRAS